jgi:hypothetical protein
MKTFSKRDLTDKLYFKLRAYGYSTLGRRFGTYIPNPPNIGEFEIDILAKLKKEFAIGIVIDDLRGVDFEFIRKKLTFLAERKSTYSGNPVKLFIALTRANYFLIKHLIDTDLKEHSCNIELVLVELETDLFIIEGNPTSKSSFQRYIN